VKELVARQVAEHGIVVWYDPQQSYRQLAAGLELPDCKVLSYENGFFALRHALEPLIEFVQQDGKLDESKGVPPRVVIYLPMARRESHYALIEAESCGVVLEPDTPQPECNTRLGRVVREIFGVVAPLRAEQLARQADDGVLTLAELDHIAGESGAATMGALQVIFGKKANDEILLHFLAVPEYDEAIEAKGAEAELRLLIKSELGLETPAAEGCGALRGSVGRYLVQSELLLAVPQAGWPEALAQAGLPESSSQRANLQQLCSKWRNQGDIKAAYVGMADAIEATLPQGRSSWPLEHLQQVDTFRFIEKLMLEEAIELYLHNDHGIAAEMVALRSQRFWAREDLVLQLAWQVVESATALESRREEIGKELREHKWQLDELVSAYALHARPWSHLERLSRELEARHASWESAADDPQLLERLLVKARRGYLHTAGAVAESYNRALHGAKLEKSQYWGHCRVFQRFVMPLLESGEKVAFLMIDALRYEMAQELIEGLGDEYQATTTPILGMLPGITPFGMAALLPGAEGGVQLNEKAKGTPEVAIGGTAVESRLRRLNWIEQQVGVPLCKAKLVDVLRPAFRKDEKFKAARLVVVTSQEIDQLGEEGDEENIRHYLGDVLDKLRRAIRALARLGVKDFVLATDHGFAYAPGLAEGLLMDSPGGATADNGSRFWLGKGGSSEAGFLRFTAAQLGWQSDYEVALPLGFGQFRAKGGQSAYFHGGASPAENILPVVTLHYQQRDATTMATVEMKLDKLEITNRLFSITLVLKSGDFFAEPERRVILDVVSGRKSVGTVMAATYGLEVGAGELLLKSGAENLVTLKLDDESVKSLTIRIRDCQTQNVVAQSEGIPVSIAF